MFIIFAGKGTILVTFACIVLLPLGIFLSLVLFAGLSWGVSILIFVIVLPCLYWLFSDRVAYVAAGGGGLPVQQPEVTPPFQQQRGGGVTYGLGASAIAALPAYAYEKKGGADECTVCLGELQRGEAVKQLPACAHLFHGVCIDAWLTSQVTCPVCRSPVDIRALPPTAEFEAVLRIQ